MFCCASDCEMGTYMYWVFSMLRRMNVSKSFDAGRVKLKAVIALISRA